MLQTFAAEELARSRSRASIECMDGLLSLLLYLSFSLSFFLQCQLFMLFQDDDFEATTPPGLAFRSDL